MADIRDQYEAYPYPERDPADEARRLVVGSPSDPREIDHFLFGGHRDWSKPFKALVAGGGTGDGLVQLAQLLTSAKVSYEITYIDLSSASRAVAEARIDARHLSGVTFVTGSLLDAAHYGPFDYIDCCGVLHHLPDPAAGFAALRAAMSESGGMGFMVYAPYGRSGVYPLQEAFGTLLAGRAPADKLRLARDIMDAVPDGHPFKRNPHVVDHRQSDAGFYDLLLHSQDQAFDVKQLLSVLDQTGWGLAGFCEAGLYDLGRYTKPPEGLPVADQWAVAEQISGSIKTHVGYAAPVGRVVSHDPKDRSLVPHLRGGRPDQIASAVAAGRRLPITRGGVRVTLDVPREAAPLLARVNGVRSVAQVFKSARLDLIEAGAIWAKIEKVLLPWGLLLYSDLLKARS